MKKCLQAVLFVASIIATTSKELSDPCFSKITGVLQCGERDLAQPPAGYLPEIQRADLTNNKIAVLYKYSLTGFPRVKELELQYNELTELDLDVFAPLTALQTLNLQNNKINSLSSSTGLRLESLKVISLVKNDLTSLDPDVFLVAPNLDFLSLNENPIVVRSGQPILNHPSITSLDMKYATLGALGERSFAGLPNLLILLLHSCGITDITGAFVHNHALKLISLQKNRITEIKTGTFAEGIVLLELELDHNPLAHVETSAVADVIPPTGYIGIAYSPLACKCDYDSLFWWAKKKRVSISASCYGSGRSCTFMKKENEEL